MNNTIWTAVGAIGQILCAIATFCAVIVALKPYRKKVVVTLKRIKMVMGNEEMTLPVCIHIRNEGAKPIKIIKIGIKEKFETIIIEGEYPIEDEDQANFSINQRQLLESFYNEQEDKFSIIAYDSKGNYYTSQKYHKQIFAENEAISDLFK